MQKEKQFPAPMTYESIYVIGWNHVWSGVVDGVVYSLVEGFTHAGYRSKSIIFGRDKVPANLADLLNTQDRKLVIGVTHTSLFFTIGEKSLWDLVDADFATYFIDNPAFFAPNGLHHLLSAPERMKFLFSDNSHMQQFRSYLMAHEKQNDCIFFPFAANFQATRNQRTINCISDAKIVIFANVGQEAPQIFHQIEKGTNEFPIIQNSNLPSVKKSFLINDLPISNYDFDLYEFFSGYSAREHLYLDEDLLRLFLATDSYLKRYRRLFVIWQLKQFNLEVYGSGWSTLAGDISDKWTLHDTVNYNSQYGIFLNADFVLNVDPVWPSGIHDRVFNAMSCGAIPITNFNKLTSFFLNAGLDAVVYKAATDIPEQLRSISNNINRAKQLALKTFKSQHQWKHRINILVEHFRE